MRTLAIRLLSFAAAATILAGCASTPRGDAPPPPEAAATDAEPWRSLPEPTLDLADFRIIANWDFDAL